MHKTENAFLARTNEEQSISVEAYFAVQYFYDIKVFPILPSCRCHIIMTFHH